MPCTAIKIEKNDGTVFRLKFLTIGNPTHTDVDVYRCNDDFIPIGEPESGMDERDEETYHKELRIKASEKGQFVPEQSTDPNWNPGYVEPAEDEDPV